VASEWADRLIDVVRLSWSPDQDTRGFFKGTFPCLSALVALGRKAEALRYAEASRGRNDQPGPISRACEEILLSSGSNTSGSAPH
jgi:hypothetical protein